MRPQALHGVVSRKWCKLEPKLLYNVNITLYAVYRPVLFPMYFNTYIFISGNYGP